MTFELAMRLRRKGKFVVLNVDEKQGGRLQMPVISHDVILNGKNSSREKPNYIEYL
jgi:hypothetical protein